LILFSRKNTPDFKKKTRSIFNLINENQAFRFIKQKLKQGFRFVKQKLTRFCFFQKILMIFNFNEFFIKTSFRFVKQKLNQIFFFLVSLEISEKFLEKKNFIRKKFLIMTKTNIFLCSRLYHLISNEWL